MCGNAVGSCGEVRGGSPQSCVCQRAPEDHWCPHTRCKVHAFVKYRVKLNRSAYFTGLNDFCVVVEGSAQSCSTREGDEDWRREETSQLDAPGAIRPPQSAERGRPEELLQYETTFPLPVHTGHGELAGSDVIIGMQKRPEREVCAAPDMVFCFVVSFVVFGRFFDC